MTRGLSYYQKMKIIAWQWLKHNLWDAAGSYWNRFWLSKYNIGYVYKINAWLLYDSSLYYYLWTDWQLLFIALFRTFF